MPEKILVAVHDPGGASAISPVLVRLREESSISLSIYAGCVSEYIMVQKGLRHKKLATNLQLDQAAQMLSMEFPDLLITGTSWNSNAEQALRNAAYQRKLRSVVMLDSWSNYRVRWNGSIYPISRTADKICIMDEATKLEMVAAGFPDSSLVVTGQPYLDEVFSTSNKNGTSSYKARENKSSKQTILFLSQPLVNLDVADMQTSGNHPIQVMIRALRRLVREEQQEVELMIKLHPKEEICRELKSIIEISKAQSLKIRLANKDAKLNELVDRADVVMGYNTVALFEAKARGKRVLSLNYPLGCQALNSAMSDAGIKLVSPTERDIVSATLERPRTGKRSLNNFNGSIENTIRCIRAQLGFLKLEPTHMLKAQNRLWTASQS